VVVCPGDEKEVLSALDSLGYKRPRLKPGVPKYLVPAKTTCTLMQDCSNAASSQVPNESDVSGESANESLQNTVWLGALRTMVTEARLVHVNVRNTFLEEPQETQLTPRSIYTASAPAAMEQPVTTYAHGGVEAGATNPRIWTKQF